MAWSLQLFALVGLCFVFLFDFVFVSVSPHLHCKSKPLVCHSGLFNHLADLATSSSSTSHSSNPKLHAFTGSFTDFQSAVHLLLAGKFVFISLTSRDPSGVPSGDIHFWVLSCFSGAKVCRLQQRGKKNGRFQHGFSSMFWTTFQKIKCY